MSKVMEVELDKETVEKFEEIKKYLGIEDDAEAWRYIIKWFIRKKMGVPTIKRCYQLKSSKFFDEEKENEVTPFVSFKLQRIREALEIEVSDDVSAVEFEQSDAEPTADMPCITMTFRLVDGGEMIISFWYDAANKLVEFFKEVIKKIECIDDLKRA